MSSMISVTQSGSGAVAVGLTFQSLFVEEDGERVEIYPSMYEEGFAVWECGGIDFDAYPSDEAKFGSLVEAWYRERGTSSSITEIVLCSSYLAIIAMGKDKAVPLILAQIEREGDDPDHWFWALQVLTGVDPVTEEDEGDMLRMSQAWRAWGRAEGYAW